MDSDWRGLISSYPLAQGYHRTSVTSNPPKVQERFVYPFRGISRESVMNKAWWLLLLSSRPVSAERLYSDLLPSLLGAPLYDSLAYR
jgi:hypothetical protein